MNVWVMLRIGPHDRPVLTIEPEAEADGEEMTVRLTQDVSVTGTRAEVERWVRDLATQLAMQEA